MDINIDFVPFTLSDTNSNHWITVNQDIMDLDCFGVSGGLGECDDCGICDGDNINMDDCDVCFGNNLDMDCNPDLYSNLYYHIKDPLHITDYHQHL